MIFPSRNRSPLPGSLRGFFGIVLTAAAWGIGAEARGATATWVGNVSGSWSNASNWSNGKAPASQNALAFGAAGLAGASLTDNLMTPASYSLTGVTFASGAAAFTIAAGTAGANGFTLTSGGITNSGTQTETIADAIALGGPQTVTTSANGGNIALQGILSGTGGLTANGGGTVILTGANTYSGGTAFAAGAVLQLQANSGNTTTGVSSVLPTVNMSNTQLPGGSTIQLRADSTVASGGVVAFDSGATSFGANTSGNHINGILNFDVNQLSTGSNLTLDFGATNATWNMGTPASGTTTINVTGGNGYSLQLGTLLVGQNASLVLNPTTANLIIAGISNGSTGSITKNGAGTWTASGPCAYTGSTAVIAGDLVVTGTLSTTSSVAVWPGATLEDDGLVNNALTVLSAGALAGRGSIGGINLNAGGTLAAGYTAAAAGSLSASGNVTLGGSASAFNVHMGVAHPGDATQLAMNAGSLSLAGATLQVTMGPAYSRQAVGTTYVIVNGGATGTGSNGNVFAQGSQVIAPNGDVFNILYASNAGGSGTGSDVVLQLAALGTPSNFTATQEWNEGSPFAALQWSGGTGAASYLLERAPGGGSYQRVCALNAAATAYNDYSISPNTSYTYALFTINSSGTSAAATASFTAGAAIPLGYLAYGQALAPAAGDSLAPGTLWTDTAANGVPNALNYAFGSNPSLRGNPGELFLQPAASGTLQLWTNAFGERDDVHYNLQGSPDLDNWTTYLTEESASVAQAGSAASGTFPLLGVTPPSPQFFRWSLAPNTSAAAAPAGLLVDGLSGSSGAAVTQENPVFSWEVGNNSQTAYEILVATSPSLLTPGLANVWNSGVVSGSNSLGIPFAGLSLQSDTTYYWTVCTWDSAGYSSTFAPAQSFTTGALTGSYKTDAPTLVEEPISPARFVPLGSGTYFADFGNDAWGKVQLTIPSPVNGQTVTVEMGEELSGTDTVDASPPSGSYIRYQSQTITMQTGVTTYTVTPAWNNLYSGYVSPPSYIGQVAPFRYVQVSNVPGAFTSSDINQLAVHVPFNSSAASFNSSDPLLNAIWALCVHTTIASTFDSIYVDGDRERIPYEADGYIHMLNHYCVDRDFATPRLSAEYLYANPTWPTEWPMHCILMAWTDYLYTGDMRSLEANYSTLQGKLFLSGTTGGHQFGRRPSDGLFQNDTATGGGSYPGNIVDIIDWPAGNVTDVNGTNWPEGERDSYDMTSAVKTVLAAFHYQTLTLMRQIATALGKTSDAANYQSMAATTLASVNSRLWNSTGNYYVDGLTVSGTTLAASVTGTSSHAALHANMFPLAFNMVPQNQIPSVLNYIESRGLVCSPYGAQYLFQSLYQANGGAYALSLFDSTGLRSWYNMMHYADSTAKPNQTVSTLTLEAWDLSLKTSLDWNHAWGSAPANLIPRCLMGVRPLLPGYQKILLQPQPGALAYANLTMPTVLGSVTEDIQTNTAADFAMTVNIPPNATALVGLPALGGTGTVVYMDGAAVTPGVAGQTLNPQWAASEKPAGVSSTGLILSGSAVWVDNVPPGPHTFEALP